MIHLLREKMKNPDHLFVPPKFRKDDEEHLHIGETMGGHWTTQNLYLISIFAKPADGVGGQEGWIRSLPLLVLMYEELFLGLLRTLIVPLSYISVSRQSYPESLGKR